MNIQGKHYRTIWPEDDYKVIKIIDQRYLPHQFVIEEIRTFDDALTAIVDMHVRGAGLIGAAAGYAMVLATVEATGKNSFTGFVTECARSLRNARPTAVNLEYAVNRQLAAMEKGKNLGEKIVLAKETASSIADEDAEQCKRIGLHGLGILKEISNKSSGKTINVLTHCNAGWLAFVDHGSALAPVYEAFDNGIDLHVWVDETRPRNQGSSLTAWELYNHGVPHTVIADNTGGHLMQHRMVDVVITGADRVTRKGDVANKIGTYLKALAAHDNAVPFYVAFPSSTLDCNISDGIREIPIEKRNENEVKYIKGLYREEIKEVLLTPRYSNAANYGFDVTPARLITGLMTERGICRANEEEILRMYPEKARS